MADEEIIEATVDGGKAGGNKTTVLALVGLSVLVMVLTPVITIVTVKAMTGSEESGVEPEKRIEIPLDQIQVNVAGTNGTRYLQVQIVVEVSDSGMMPLFTDRSEENPHGQLKRIMSTIIAIVSDKGLDGLLSRDAKARLADEIVRALNDLLRDSASGIVTDVYFYGFLIQ